jgi:hypothetical protein
MSSAQVCRSLRSRSGVHQSCGKARCSAPPPILSVLDQPGADLVYLGSGRSGLVHRHIGTAQHPSPVSCAARRFADASSPATMCGDDLAAAQGRLTNNRHKHPLLDHPARQSYNSHRGNVGTLKIGSMEIR